MMRLQGVFVSVYYSCPQSQKAKTFVSLGLAPEPDCDSSFTLSLWGVHRRNSSPVRKRVVKLDECVCRVWLCFSRTHHTTHTHTHTRCLSQQPDSHLPTQRRGQSLRQHCGGMHGSSTVSSIWHHPIRQLSRDMRHLLEALLQLYRE